MNRKTALSRKVIFIGGSSYSGSTMMDMMLGNDSHGFSAGEVHALFHPYRPHHFHPVCGCGNEDCDFWSSVLSAGEEGLYRSIFQQLPDARYIVDSSKNPWWIRKQSGLLKSQNIDVFNFLVWKTPVEFAYSMLKRGRKGWRNAWLSYYRVYMTLIDDYVGVPYSSLTENPSGVLRNLCEFIGIPYSQGKEKFWEGGHHTIFGNDSAKIHTRELPEQEGGDDDGIGVRSNTRIDGYRTIYRLGNIRDRLDADTLRQIDNDRLLQGLLAQLQNVSWPQSIVTEADQAAPGLRAEYRAPRLVLARSWAGDACRNVVGRAVGRYLKVF